jgi:ketosteroid isomerase-like protein
MTKRAEQEITAVVRDYFEGWFEGDVARMDRALHPELVKRSPTRSLGLTTTKERMLEFTAAHEGAADVGDGRIDIAIEDVFGDIASVTVRGGIYHEYVHLVHTDDGWRIANALWCLR